MSSDADFILGLGGIRQDPDGTYAKGPKYPDISVQLVGTDGNAFALLAVVDRALARGGVSQDERKAFRTEATSGNYDYLLTTCMKWVNVR